MEYRQLGTSGLQVSALSFGAWVTVGGQIDGGTADACMSAAYEAGVNFFDNAESYSGGNAELEMGRILREKGWDRDSFVVSSKVFFGSGKQGPNQRGLGRKHMVEACDAALKRLQVDYLDLYFCHRHDPNTPIEEVVWTMNDLISQGKIFYWGTSEWSGEQIRYAHEFARKTNLRGPTMEQPQYNMLARGRVESEYASLYRDYGMGTTIWSPLASGVLTGKYNDGIPADSRMAIKGYEWLRQRVENETFKQEVPKIRKLAELADDLGVKLPQMALAWCLKNPNVSTVITGASKLSQLESNLKALEIVSMLTDEVMEQIESILDNRPENPEKGAGFDR